MDTSGSMDTMKKYLARSFFFLLYQFISTRYRNVEIVFIAHHTEAYEVTEEASQARTVPARARSGPAIAWASNSTRRTTRSRN